VQGVAADGEGGQQGGQASGVGRTQQVTLGEELDRGGLAQDHLPGDAPLNHKEPRIRHLPGLERPHPGEAGSASVDSEVVWQVLEPTRLAVLDRDFLLSVQLWPDVTAALLRRQERRAEWLSNVLAISHLPRVELRVLVLFWQFADHWGKVRGGEVSVPIPLTHLNVARLIGARRPTVTTALGRLAEAGLVVQEGNGHWLLRGGPPQQLRDASAGTAPDEPSAGDFGT
jgi:hypothetical protein